jgi:hypothetical protein
VEWKDDAEAIGFFVFPGARLNATLLREAGTRQPEIQILGNREGLASLANVFLWLHANAFRREVLSLAKLPFATMSGKLALALRVTDAKSYGTFGRCRSLGVGEAFEWSLSEDDLLRLAVQVHHLVSLEGHEYELFGPLPGEEGWDGLVHLRIT